MKTQGNDSTKMTQQLGQQMDAALSEAASAQNNTNDLAGKGPNGAANMSPRQSGETRMTP
jgi:hypothetical protein